MANSYIQLNDNCFQKSLRAKECILLVESYELKLRHELHDILELCTKVSEVVNNSDFKPVYQINIFDYYGGIIETGTSYFLKEILNYKKGKDAIIVKSFVEHFLCDTDFDLSWIKEPNIICEYHNIDIIIKEKREDKSNYAIIIENKLKGAVFQRNQLARYIATLEGKGLDYDENKIFIVVLPDKKYNYDLHLQCSTWRLPPDWEKPNSQRQCRLKNNETRCYCDIGKELPCCAKCDKNIKKRFKLRTKIVYDELSEWLENDCINAIPSEEKPLRTTIYQFSNYLRGLYNNRINDKLLMDIKEFLKKELFQSDSKASAIDQWKVVNDKINDINYLEAGLNKLREDLAKESIREWYNELKTQYQQLEFNDNNKQFDLTIQNIGCGCRVDNSNGIQKFKWFFWVDPSSIKDNKGNINKEKEEEIKSIVNGIIDNANYSGSELSERQSNINGGDICFGFTENGAKLCKALFESALELKYINN